MKRLIVRGAVAVLVAGLSAGCSSGGGSNGQVPTFQVDGLWPQPLDYPYILGPVSGVTVAPNGNVLIVTRQDGFNPVNEINSAVTPPTGTCCTPTQAVLEFAPDGSLVRQWGGPDMGYPWPARPHGIAIDPAGNVWIGGGVAPPAPAGRGGRGGRGARGAPPGPPPSPTVDDFILKFSRDGQHMMTIGGNGEFGGANGFSFDADANEAYVADGYANNRVVVLDITTGAEKRSWGAYGKAPAAPAGPYDPNASSPPQQFRTVTCAMLSNDGLVYVCDRGNDRIQVFQKDGTFVKEATIEGSTLGDGSVWDIAFSPDADQQFLYVADGMNERVHILDRQSLQVLTSFGAGGRYPGHFTEVGGVAVDSQGDVYTSEDGQGRRVQKFTHTGMGPVTTQDEGPLYPASSAQ
jgi:hypothetical protein